MTKAYEVKKGDAEIKRGLVMMAIEGPSELVETISKALEAEGYASTKCSDEGDNDGEIIEYFMISRTNKADFMHTYKTAK